MSILGIDYGSKKVGVAVSDEGDKLAFPKGVVPNDNNLFGHIEKLCNERKIKTVVIGVSKYLGGEKNEIQKRIESFSEHLSDKLAVEVVGEPEFLTTIEARRLPGDKRGDNYIKGNVDGEAAAIILQSYLDKRNNKEADG